MREQVDTLEAVLVTNPETGKHDLRHPACAGDDEVVDGPPVMVEREPNPPTCTACGKPFESGKVQTPDIYQTIRPADRDEDDDEGGPAIITVH